VIPPGIDLKRFSLRREEPEARRKLGVGTGDFCFLFAGRLIREKGVFELADAAARMAGDSECAEKSWNVVMVGGGNAEEELRRKVAVAGTENRVVFAGTRSYAEMPAVYDACDAFVAPSVPMPHWEEQFGMVLAEAMASGKPVISTRSGSIPDVVGNAGVLVEPRNAGELAAAMKKMMLDSRTRKKLAAAGRKRAEREFDCRKTAKRMEKAYESLF